MAARRIHLVGIGGIGLSAIAKILLAQGVAVSGSDLKASALTDELQKFGAKIFIGHRAENISDVDLVLITSAAQQDNPEVLEALRRGIHISKRHEFFPELTHGKKVIAIAGTHGKTTTTGMIGVILTRAGLDPNIIVGGIIPELNGNARAGQGKYFVIEADEYDRAFLGLTPNVAVVTAIEMDHPDIFRDALEVQGAFHQFLGRVEPDGKIFGYGDDQRISNELERMNNAETFGFDEKNNWRAIEIKSNDVGGNNFIAMHNNHRISDFELRIPGLHNVLNALAAIAVADRLEIPGEVTRETLRSFRGVARRFEIKGTFNGVTVIDDYAHHPTEIRATLRAARERFPGRKLWAVFQPHTYTRTQALLDEFANSFDDADHVIVTEIFAARETNELAVSGRDVVARSNHSDVRYSASLGEAVEIIAREICAGNVLITLGAGDVNWVGGELAHRWGGENARAI